jgi:transcriptional regulator of acetoin/glycerol metabolism
MRLEVSLSLVWTAGDGIALKEIPTVQQFMTAVRQLMGIRSVRVAGNVALLDTLLTEATQLPASLVAPLAVAAPLEPADRLKTEVIEALRATGGNVAAAARQLGVARQTLYRWLKKFGLNGRWEPDMS